MKTYSEENGKPNINWFEELNKPDIDWKNLEERSGEWVTCACGNQCSIIPRYKSGAPLDEELELLGIDFHEDILSKHREEALETLHAIERRSAEVIKQIEA